MQSGALSAGGALFPEADAIGDDKSSGGVTRPPRLGFAGKVLGIVPGRWSRASRSSTAMASLSRVGRHGANAS